MSVVRQLREQLGLSQEKMAQLLGRSVMSLRNYERGIAIPSDIIERMRKLALDNHLIASAEALGQPAPKKAGAQLSRRAQSHADVDEIYDSEVDNAVEAIEHNLHTFVDYVRVKKGTRK